MVPKFLFVVDLGAERRLLVGKARASPENTCETGSQGQVPISW
jgi:hypothetical protein